MTVCLAVLALCACLGAPVASQKKPKDDGRKHPYLYFSAEELDGLKAKLKKPPFAARWTTLLANADYFVGQPVCGGSVETGQEKSRPALGIIGITAFAYAITGEKKYAERAKKEAFNLLEEKKWYTDRGWNKGAELATSEASAACALCYDWCFDTFSEAERKDFVEKLLDRSTKPYLASIEQHKDWWVDNDVTNWCGVCHGGCGLAALALYDESPDAKKAYDYARAHVPKFLEHAIGEDGGGHEGVMYWRYGVEFGLMFATAARHAFPDKELDAMFDTIGRKLAGYWDIAMQGPDMKYANFNDMGEDTFASLYGTDRRSYEGGPSAALCALFDSCHLNKGAPTTNEPRKEGDFLLLWGADLGGAAFYYRGTSPFWFIWRRDTPPAGEKPKLPDAMLFRDCGHTIWKSDDLWLAYNGGWVSDKSHCNFDLGTFVLVYKGERFVADPGYGKTATAEHSTVSINAKDQPKGAQAEYLGWETGKGYSYFVSDLSKCYDGTLKRFQRQFVLIDGKMLVIIDDLEADGKPDFDWRLQSRFDVALDKNVATLKGKDSVLHVVSVGPRGCVVSSGKATLNYVSIKPGEVQSGQVFITVLYPGPAGTKAPKCELKSKGAGSVLSISGSNGDATLEFKRGSSWTLSKVGSEKVAAPSPPKGRQFTQVK